MVAYLFSDWVFLRLYWFYIEVCLGVVCFVLQTQTLIDGKVDSNYFFNLLLLKTLLLCVVLWCKFSPSVIVVSILKLVWQNKVMLIFIFRIRFFELKTELTVCSAVISSVWALKCLYSAILSAKTRYVLSDTEIFLKILIRNTRNLFLIKTLRY
jgi:hypothetical protein